VDESLQLRVDAYLARARGFKAEMERQKGLTDAGLVPPITVSHNGQTISWQQYADETARGLAEEYQRLLEAGAFGGPGEYRLIGYS
jgi:hypothetical protein